jgi:hypothetical protein
MIKFYFLFSLIFVIQAQKYGCIAFKDNYLFFTNHTDGNVTVELYGAGRFGYVGLSFVGIQSFNILPNLFILSDLTDNVWRMSNHMVNDSLPISSTVDKAVGLKIDDRFHITIKVPYSMIGNAKYIAIARG